jgi:hypothetical protein
MPFMLAVEQPFTSEELEMIADWEVGWYFDTLGPEDQAFVVSICPVRNPDNFKWWYESKIIADWEAGWQFNTWYDTAPHSHDAARGLVWGMIMGIVDWLW